MKKYLFSILLMLLSHSHVLGVDFCASVKTTLFTESEFQLIISAIEEQLPDLRHREVIKHCIYTDDILQFIFKPDVYDLVLTNFPVVWCKRNTTNAEDVGWQCKIKRHEKGMSYKSRLVTLGEGISEDDARSVIKAIERFAKLHPDGYHYDGKGKSPSFQILTEHYSMIDRIFRSKDHVSVNMGGGYNFRAHLKRINCGLKVCDFKIIDFSGLYL